MSDDCIKSTKRKRGRTPLNRGKLLLAGKKGKVRSFWETNQNAIELALDDSYCPQAQIGGNYALTKHFLKNHWKHVEEFKIKDLEAALAEKYPERVYCGVFRLQRWHDASYWEATQELAIKPIYKKASYRSYHNIFYIEPD